LGSLPPTPPYVPSGIRRFQSLHLPCRVAFCQTEVSGTPRVINNLCLNALLLGAQAKREQIDAETVRLASLETGM
jgi:hypothetical protein